MDEGFADIAFLPRQKSDSPTMLVELKYDYTAESAIDQIMAEKYAGKLMNQLTKSPEHFRGQNSFSFISYLVYPHSLHYFYYRFPNETYLMALISIYIF